MEDLFTRCISCYNHRRFLMAPNSKQNTIYQEEKKHYKYILKISEQYMMSDPKWPLEKQFSFFQKANNVRVKKPPAGGHLRRLAPITHKKNNNR